MLFPWLRTWARRCLASSRPQRPHARPSLEDLEARVLLAAPTVWASRGVGGGGALFAPSLSPHDPADLYISSDMGELFQSRDTGTSWDVVDFRDLQGNRPSQVQFTDDPNLLFSIDDTADAPKPARSTDGGATWMPLAADPTDGGAIVLRADPNSHTRLLLSDWTRLFVSNDGGASFTQRFSTTDTGAGLHVAGAFFDGNAIFVGTSKGLLVSTDGGNSFTVSSVGGIPSGQAMVSFAGAKQGGTTRLFAVTMDSGSVYAGIAGEDHWGYQGVYALDWGQPAWTLRTSGIPSRGHPFYVSAAVSNINVAYLAGGSTDGAPTVYKTSDGGVSWQDVFRTTNNQNINTAWGGAGGDRSWGYGEYALGFAVSMSNPGRAVLTDLGFAYMTTDGGATWQTLTVSPGDRNPVNTATPKGKSYHDSGLDNTTSWGVAWADATHLIGANSDIRGVVSADGGESWSFNYTGHSLNSMYRAVVHPGTGMVYAATSSVHDLYQTTYLTDSRIDGGTGQVLFSSNQGATWQLLNDFGHPVIWVALDPTNANRLYASVVHSTQGGIYVSSNIHDGAASTWTKLSNPPRTEGHPFNIQVLNDGTLLATYSGRRSSSGAFTASSGLFVSTDGGATWQDRSATAMRYYTKDVIVDPHDAAQNTWYVGVWSGWGGPPNGLGGLYKSSDRGLTWTRILNLDRVTSATISPVHPSEMYVTTERDGLWYTENLRATIPSFTQVASYPFRQPERVFYNPHNAAEIWVTSFGNGMRVGRTGAAPSPGSLQFALASTNAGENAGDVLLTVTRTGGSSGIVSVHYASGGGTATAGADYSARSGTLTWADGDTTNRTISIPILDDAHVEGTENLLVSLSSPSGGAVVGAPAVTTLSILDNDVGSPGNLRFQASGYTIGESTGPALITVTRMGGSAGSVSVKYASANGSATAGADYTAAFGTLTFADGETSKSFVVPIVNDTLVEGNETLTITLSEATGGASLIAPSAVTLKILDNDVASPGELRFQASGYTIGESTGPATITVTRTGGSAGSVSVNYATANGSATAGSDYTGVAGTLTFADGETSKTFVVGIVNDQLVEGNETLTISLSEPTGGARLIAPSAVTLKILDNDRPAPPTLKFGASAYVVGERAGSVLITVKRTGTMTGTVTVRYATTDGAAGASTDQTAQAGMDYAAVSGTLTFASGETSKTFSVHILDDTEVETDELFTVALSTPTGGAVLGMPRVVTVKIRENDSAIEFQPAQYAVSESGGSVLVTLVRQGNADAAASIKYRTYDGTALAGTDYTARSGTLTFGAGERSKTFGIAILNDLLAEAAESFGLALSDPTGGAQLGGAASGTVSISDNDTPTLLTPVTVKTASTLDPPWMDWQDVVAALVAPKKPS